MNNLQNWSVPLPAWQSPEKRREKIAEMEMRRQLEILVEFASWSTPGDVERCAELVAEKARAWAATQQICRERQLELEMANLQPGQCTQLAFSS